MNNKPLLDANGNQVMIDGYPVYTDHSLKISSNPDVFLLGEGYQTKYREEKQRAIDYWWNLVLDAVGGIDNWFKTFPTAVEFTAKDRIVHFERDYLHDVDPYDMRVIEIKIRFKDIVDPETGKSGLVNSRVEETPDLHENSIISKEDADKWTAKEAVASLQKFYTEHKPK